MDKAKYCAERHLDRRTIAGRKMDMIEREAARRPPMKWQQTHATRWRSGVCRICGEYCQCITNEHAERHGFKSADEMAKADVMDWTE